MKVYFQDSKWQTWEQFKENMIEPTNSYEECYRKISNVFYNYGHHEIIPWEYFKEIYHDIPREYRVPLLLELPYQSYKIKLDELIDMIDEYLQSETKQEKENRIARNKELLSHRTNGNGIILYRGIAENYLLPENALSYTLDKEVADSFLEYHNSRHGSQFGFVYDRDVSIEDENILFYSNNRSEQEVFYWSEDMNSFSAMLKLGPDYDYNYYLTEDTLIDYVDDYDIIWFND